MFQVISCSFLVLWINSFAGFGRFERWGHFGGRILGPATFQWTLISEITDSDSDQQEIKITVLSGQTTAFFEFSRVFLGPKGRRSVYNIKVYAPTLRPQKYVVFWLRFYGTAAPKLRETSGLFWLRRCGYDPPPKQHRVLTAHSPKSLIFEGFWR